MADLGDPNRMNTAEFPAARTTLGASSFKSVPDLWHHRVKSTPDGEAMIHRDADGNWVSMSWRAAADRVRRITNALLSLGLEREQRCCILATTSPDWVLVDMGILCAGGATTTIYPSNTAAECEYIVNDSDAVVVFCENDAQASKLLANQQTLKNIKHVVVFNGTPSADGWVRTLEDLEEQGARWSVQHADRYAEVSTAIQPEDMATLIYTSGTTGRPKGVILTHDAWVYESEAVDALGIISPADKQFLFLPLSHVFAKVMQIIFIRLGVPTVIDGDMDSLVSNLEVTSPSWMGAVPRVFEKAYNKIVSTPRDKGGMSQRVFKWAVGIGTEVSRLQQQGSEPGAWLRMQANLADRLVFSKVKESFGGRLRFFISGGAPLSQEIAEFFHACDILILEGYGLTESGAASCLNGVDDFRFGTVGKPLPGCEVKIADDGEILISSRGVMKGYHKLPEETERVLTEDGWLRTGDLGTILNSGHVQITGRKKDLIITAGGKKIAPAGFQGLLKSRCAYVSQVLMHGDRRNFCTALIALSVPETDEVRAEVAAAIDEVNKDLPSYEAVKKFHLCAEDWTVANGLLTATMKVRRNLVEEKYADILDSFYEGAISKL